MADRGERGRFLPGHSVKGGRKPVAVETKYYEAVAGECTMEDWKQIVHRAIGDAKNGDEKVVAKAREFLAKYLADPVLTLLATGKSDEADDERLARIAVILEGIRARTGSAGPSGNGNP